ncbi:hypothetical protein NKI34_29165 [Mesorhizobium sp. M0700]|uniref:hypothetical protein n=1 Tax=Mesorhizobium sp. M0700 TaxID=2956988 RepID=UPI003338D60E
MLWKRLCPSAEAVALQFLDDLTQAGILRLARQHHRAAAQKISMIRSLRLARIVPENGSAPISTSPAPSILPRFYGGAPA